MDLKIVDIGEHFDQPKTIKAPTKPEAYYPQQDIDAEDFPALNGKKDGEECLLVAKVKKIGTRIVTREGSEDTHKISIQIRGLGEAPVKKSDFLKDQGY